METPPKATTFFPCDQDAMEVTPFGEGDAQIAEYGVLLEKILNLLMESHADLLHMVLMQFLYHGVMKWKDMLVFTANDVEEEIKASSDPGPLKSVLICKKLGYIFEYAKHGTLTVDTMMEHIVHIVSEAKAGSSKGEENVKKMGLENKVVSTLEKFSGDNKDFYAYQDSTMNKLG
jgi:hypothetical protein